MAQTIPRPPILSCLKAKTPNLTQPKPFSTTPYPSHHHQSPFLLLSTLPPSQTSMDFVVGSPLRSHHGFAFPFLNYTCKANLSLGSAWSSKWYTLRDHVGQMQGTLTFSLSCSLPYRLQFSPKFDVYLFNTRSATFSFTQEWRSFLVNTSSVIDTTVNAWLVNTLNPQSHPMRWLSLVRFYKWIIR